MELHLSKWLCNLCCYLKATRSQKIEGSFRPSSIPPLLAIENFCMLGCCHSVFPVTLQHTLQLSALVLLHLILSSSSSEFSCVPLPASWHPFSLSICIILWIIPSVSSRVSVLFCSQSPEGVSLEAPVGGTTCFFVQGPHPSLCVLPFRRSCYYLFCDTVWDYSHPKFELPPNYMCLMCICYLCAYLTMCIHLSRWRVVDGSKTHSCISSLPPLHMDECGSV